MYRWILIALCAAGLVGGADDLNRAPTPTPAAARELEPPAPGGHNAVFADAVGQEPLLRDWLAALAVKNGWDFTIRAVSIGALPQRAEFDVLITDAAEELTLTAAQRCYVYALEPAVIAVGEKSPLRELSRADLKRIFTGKVNTWERLPGAGSGAILRFGTRPGQPGERPFTVKALGRSRLAVPPFDPDDTLSPDVIAVNHARELGALLRESSGAIAFGAWELAAEPGLRVLKIDGVAPTLPNLRDGSYPLLLKRVAVVNAGSRLEALVRAMTGADFAADFKAAGVVAPTEPVKKP